MQTRSNRLLPLACFSALLVLAACSGDPEPPMTPADSGVGVPDSGVPADTGVVPDTGPSGIEVLGNFTHDVNNVVVETVAESTDQLSTPRDLKFNPDRTNELWVANRGTESITVLQNAGTPDQTADLFREFRSGPHFLAQPSAIAFGQAGTFASIHETDERTQGPNGTPEDFMGPTLWSSNLNEFDGGHAGHLDMLHNSPNGMGIAWETGNAYWVFDGYHSSLTRYDFVDDHGLGGSDHSDGIITRYAEGDVLMVPNVPSHMVIDHATGLLYIADSGNARIGVMDTAAGTMGQNIGPNYDGATMFRMDGAQVDTLVNGADVGLILPSGIALYDGMLFVSDNLNSRIFAFTLEGELVDYLETGIATQSLMGIEVNEAGVWVVDAMEHRVVRISATP